MNSFSDRSVNRAGTNSMKWDRYKGRDVLPFWLADMEFACAPAIIDSIHKLTRQSIFGYTLPSAEQYNAVLKYLRDEKNVLAEKDWIVWLPGIVPGLGASCRAFAGDNDAVMMCTPVYPQFMLAPANQGRKAICVPLARKGMDYGFDWDAMEKCAAGTKLFLLCNPHNPVGKAFSRKELKRLVDFCKRHDIIICSDDIHCDLIVDQGAKHTAILSIEGAADRSVMLMAPSKTYNVPGLACAFAVIADADLRERFKQAIRGTSEWVNMFGLEACRVAYEECKEWHNGLISYLRGNRAYLLDFFANRMPEIKIGSCESTYMAWLDVSELGQDNAVKFFEEAGVGLSDGADYGEKQMMRLNYACPRSMLEEGLNRMERAVASLRAPVGPKSYTLDNAVENA